MTVSKLSMFATGAMNASGLKVLSAEYSYPTSTILTFLIFPIVSDELFILAPVPLILDMLLNCGNFL